MLHSNRKIILLALFILMPVSIVLATSGKRQNILSYGPGVAATAMGDSFAAMGNDLSIVYYNPALLANLKREEIYTSYWQLFDGANYAFLGFGIKRENSYFALGGTMLSRNNLDARTLIDDAPNSFSNSQLVAYMSYATYIKTIKANVGGSVRFLNDRLYTYSGSGGGIDLGISKRIYAKGRSAGKKMYLDSGLSIQNLAQVPIKMISAEDVLPIILRGGLNLSFTLFPKYNKQIDKLAYDEVSIMTDIVYGDKIFTPSVGVQYRTFGSFFPRIGWKDGLTTGFGVKFNNMFIDYAFTTKEIANFHKLGFGFRFGDYVEEETNTSPTFTDEFRKVYTQAERIYERFYRDATSLAEQDRYEDAIDVLKRAIPLNPEKNSTAKELLLTCENVVKARQTNDLINSARAYKAKGDDINALKNALTALDISTSENVKMLLNDILTRKEKKTSEAFLLVKSLYVVNITKDINIALENSDFEKAELGINRLEVITSTSDPVFVENHRKVKDRKELYTFKFVKQAMTAVKDKDFLLAYKYLSEADRISPNDSGIIDQKKLAKKNYLAEKNFTIEDNLYSDKLYYLAAINFSTDEKNLSTYNELLSFNGVHGYLPELENALIEKEIIKRIKP